MRVRHFLNGVEINDPNNYAELAIELNYDKDEPTAQVSINEWEFGVGDKRNSNDGAIISNNFINSGLASGVGVGEGIPYMVKVEYKNKSYVVFDGYIDLWNATISCDKVIGNAIEQGGIDWLRDVADSFTFEYLATPTNQGGVGLITPNDYILVPYIVSEIPNFKDVLLISLSIFVVAQELKDSIQSLIDYIGGLSGVLTFGLVVSIVTRVVYIGLLIITCINLIIDAFNLIIQPIKYHAGMNVSRLCEFGAQHLGYTFESSILSGTYKNMVLLPEKSLQNINSTKKGILGYLNKNKTEHKGYYKGTYGQLLDALKTMFNGKIIVDQATKKIKLERRDYSTATNQYQLPPVEVLEHRFNSEDFTSNILINFALDYNDKNTVQEYSGTEIQILTQPKAVNNRQMVLSRGYENRAIPFALGKRKTELTFPEQVLDPFFKVFGVIVGGAIQVINQIIGVINQVIKTVNKILKALKAVGIKISVNLQPVKPITAPNFQNLIEDRLDLLKMENDFVSVPKLLIINESTDARYNKLATTNETLLSAEYLWDNYHFIDSFDSSFTNNNQRVIKNIEKVPFCFDDFEKVRIDNKILDYDSVPAELISLKWNLQEQVAEMTFKRKEVYTNNFTTKKLIPNGK